MTNSVLLNNIDHKDLRVITTRSAAYGDDVMFALTFPAEFRNVQAHYPIVFRKTARRTVPADRPVRLPARGRTCSSARTAGMRRTCR